MKGRLISSDPYRQQFLVERAVSFSHRQRDCSELISVLPRHALQQIDGFGGSFTEGAGVVFNSMSEKTKAQFFSFIFLLRNIITLWRGCQFRAVIFPGQLRVCRFQR